MSEIKLQTKEELEIFMNPTRQEILRTLAVAGKPVTPKFLADKIGISPSSIQFHIKKLEGLGLVLLDHTEIIRGIHARFYIAADTEVTLLGSNNNTQDRQLLLMESYFGKLLDSLGKKRQRTALEDKEVFSKETNVFTGVAFLTDDEVQELSAIIRSYLKNHNQKKDGTNPWEYGILACRAED
ncbi:MAG: helix-turn-helix domain-containing protein [Blautia sp.]|uniref:ArsR/SmtB family transcription factor n=1 Tax=Blautia sp. TaxID=1955243 RepID=UPI00258538E1|nr:helix-turn-helix domain-containing protein [Blautia sp.]